MAYEYEKNVVVEIKELGARYKAPSFYAMADEVEDVYAKAKAWQTLKEDYIKNYIQACKEDRSLVQKQHYAVVICAMDCYDGKNELQDLMYDMNREDK